MNPVRARRIMTIALVAGLAWSSSAFALNPDLDINQYAHTSWKIRDGFTKGQITAIAQTPDGYLWLGTEFGLVRFDGVRPVPWQPPAGQQLPSINIRNLLATRDGSLWIATDAGLARWKDTRLTRYEALAGRYVDKLVEDHEGSIWTATAFNLDWTLCVIRHDSAECFGDDGGPGVGAIGLYADRKGNLWVGTGGKSNGVWRWRPGQSTFYAMPAQRNGIRGLLEDDDGVLLVSQNGGIARFHDGTTEMAYPFPPSKKQFEFPRMLRDRNGGLWLGSTSGGGLVHVHEGRTDVFASSDGLSGDEIRALFEDREGNIWVSTVEGLDRFHDVPVATYSAKQGLSSAHVESVLAARDGSIWVGTADRVKRWNQGRVIIYRDSGTGGVQSIFQDSLERVWISTLRDIGYLQHGRFVALTALGRGPIRSIVEDGDASLWIANDDLGLFRVSTGTGYINQWPWDDLKHKTAASAMSADRSQSGVWIGFPSGGVVHFADGQVRTSYGTEDGLGAGRVRSLRLDRDGTVWAATEGGLSRLKDGRATTLTARNGLPCDEVHWNIEDNDGAMWIAMRCGLVHVPRPELDAWKAAVQKDRSASAFVRVDVYDGADGVRIFPSPNYVSSPVAKSADGKLWFVAEGGVSVVDPRRLHVNDLPPPVHIEQIVADRKAYDAEALARGHMSLTALTRDLQIDYTALSLVAPEKMRFRYKLEGHDRDWQDVGTRRQAFYNDLPPRSYRFRVSASNNSGVWNEAGATLEFSIAPAYYQTEWFRAASVATILLLLAGLHRLRVMYLAQRLTIRMEERVNERTRLARDLHDTLLQSFQGVLLKFGALSYQLTDRPEVKRRLETILDEASQAMTEGRDAVQALRSSTVVTNDLAQAISALGDELGREHGERGDGVAPHFRVQVEGASRDLVPLARDDVFRIAGEALRNAFRHARPTRVEVEIRYDAWQLRVRVRDDGAGIDPVVLAEGRREGHYGLAGMRERAGLVGGTLTIWSDAHGGTEIELTVPAARAYAKSATGAPISEGQTT